MMSEYIEGTPKPQPRVKAVTRGKHAACLHPYTADAWRETLTEGLERHADNDIEGRSLSS